MASVAFGSTVAASVAAASGMTRRARRSVLAVVPPAATRGGPAPAKEEKGLGETIFGFIFKKDQLVETDPLLNKVGGGAPAAAATSRAKPRAATTSGKKAAATDDGGSGGGFSLPGLGGLFAKKSS